MKKQLVLILSTFMGLSACSDESDDNPPANPPVVELTESYTEPAGVNCPDGGTLYLIGFDHNSDGRLNTSEITERRYRCAPTDIDNEPPVITALSAVEMSYRQALNVTVDVTDPESNPVVVTWTILSSPEAGDMEISVVDSFESVSLMASTVGHYVVQVQAYDGINRSTADIAVDVVNHAPTYGGLVLTPELPSAGSMIYVDIQGVEDEDGDDVDATYYWSFGGELRFTTDSPYLPPFSVPKGNTLVVYAELSDGANSVVTDTATVLINNSAPAYDSISFLTPNVDTTDAIQVEVSGAHDDDGDTLTITYAWTVNGTAVGSASSNTLTAGVARKDDVVAVTARISDGTAITTTTSVSLVVQDAPPVATVTGLVNSISSGQTMRLNVSVHDPDIGAVTPLLAYGPSGMAIDGAGNVSWTPDDIMFLQEETFRFGFKVAADDEVIAAHSVVVRDLDRLMPIARSGIEVPKTNHSIWVGDYDGDDKNEILLTDSKNLIFTLEYDGSSYKQDWLYPFWFADTGNIVQLLSADINEDGRPDIIVVTTDNISVITDLSKPATTVFHSEDSSIVAAAVENIDSDGDLEIAVLHQSKLEVYNLSDWSLEFEHALSGSARSVLIGNVDNDSAKEIIVDTGYVFDGVTGSNEWYLSGGFGSKLAVGDVNNDGVDEILGTTGWPYPKLYSAVLKSELWQIVNDDICTVNIQNIDNDPQEELLIGNCQWGDVIAYDAITGAPVEQNRWDTVEHASISLTAADPDDDGEIELIWGSGITSSGEDVLVVGEKDPAAFTYYNRNPSQLDYFTAAGWANIDPDTSMAVFLAPETDSGYNGQRIIQMDVEGNLSVSSQISTNWDNSRYAKATDYDNDGFADIFMATASLYDGEFQVRQLSDNSLEFGGNGGDYDDNIGVVESFRVNQDAYEDAIYVNSNTVRVVDVVNETVLWNSTTFGEWINDVAAIANPGGNAKIVVATSNELSIWRSSAGTYVREFTAATGCKRIAVRPQSSQIVCLRDTSDYYPDSSNFIIYNANLTRLSSFDIDGDVTDFILEQAENSSNLLIANHPGGYSGYSDPRANAVLSLISNNGDLIWQSKELLDPIQHRSLFYLPEMAGENKRVTFATPDAMYISR